MQRDFIKKKSFKDFIMSIQLSKLMGNQNNNYLLTKNMFNKSALQLTKKKKQLSL